jgi:hypothetical protein
MADAIKEFGSKIHSAVNMRRMAECPAVGEGAGKLNAE